MLVRLEGRRSWDEGARRREAVIGFASNDKKKNNTHSLKAGKKRDFYLK